MNTFNPSYRQQLIDQYPTEVVNQITNTPKTVPSAVSGVEVPYVSVSSVNNSDDDPTIIIVPGFNEGIVNKASFVAELAIKGANVIMPDQNREGIDKNQDGNPDATLSQANNYIPIIEEAKKSGKKITVVSRSYGSLVLAKMVDTQPELFSDIDIVMLTPSGLIKDESLGKIGKRYVKYIKSETNQDRPMTFPDPDKVTAKASEKSFKKNIKRSIKEIFDMKKLTINLNSLSARVRSLTILSYAEDEMHPHKLQEGIIKEAIIDGEVPIVWATPVRFDGRVKEDGTYEPGIYGYGGDGAVHDDEQFNPARVADALLSAIKQANS